MGLGKIMRCYKLKKQQIEGLINLHGGQCLVQGITVSFEAITDLFL